MKHVTVVLLCLVILGGSGRYEIALAEDSHVPQGKVPEFYNWLEKYQNPTFRSGLQNASQQTHLAPSQKVHTEGQQALEPAESPSSQTEDPSLLSTTDGPAAPGEGLGCFYHRSYYSHLPLFDKGNTYTLPGSLDVAEPYQKPLSGAAASSVGMSVQSAPPR